MDAVRFLQERKRMCAERPCVACPVYATGQGCTEDDNPELAVATVEEWSALHPRKTRQSVFLEQYPEARVDDIGVLRVCPAIVSTAHRGDKGGCSDISKDCAVCRREFWMQEVE
jgi:hypothetical protein